MPATTGAVYLPDCALEGEVPLSIQLLTLLHLGLAKFQQVEGEGGAGEKDSRCEPCCSWS